MFQYISDIYIYIYICDFSIIFTKLNHDWCRNLTTDKHWFRHPHGYKQECLQPSKVEEQGWGLFIYESSNSCVCPWNSRSDLLSHILSTKCGWNLNVIVMCSKCLFVHVLIRAHEKETSYLVTNLFWSNGFVRTMGGVICNSTHTESCEPKCLAFMGSM